ncbi:MAG: MFS transporter [Desulfotignum sp.]|nr:MFS transporter [Desulfotignum sp.]
MIKLPTFISKNPRLAFYSLLAVAASGFGQTFFISVMGGELRQVFELSHTAYGSLYSGATLVSAFLLFRFGALADTWSLPKVTSLAVAILAGGCLAIGFAFSSLLLFLGFVLIRFGGQGFISHLGITTAARCFSSRRGRAVAMAELGFPLSEAVLPAGAVFIITHMGWRWSWLAGALFLVAVVWPLLLFLAKKTPAFNQDGKTPVQKKETPDMNRKQVLRDPGFYLVLPATLAIPFTITALFFHQVAIADAQGWSVQLLGRAFSGYALGHLLTLFVAGTLVDRISAGRTLPLGLIPLAASLVLLALVQAEWAAYVYLVLIGMASGLCATAGGAVWAERYGLRHLGAIRAMTQAIMVFSTAVAPVLLGFFLDSGIGVTVLAIFMAAVVLVISFLSAMPVLRQN